MSSNEYMREYMLKRYHQRMQQAREMLGNVCIICSTTENLQLDHIKPSTKEFTVGGSLWNVSKSKFEEEIGKCQLLCSDCHSDKSIKDAGKQKAKGKHGTVSTYRYCHCVLCKKAKSDYSREYKRKRSRSAEAGAPNF